MKEEIKKYLETKNIENETLRQKYRQEDLDNCIKYINCRARELLKGNGFIANEIVYSWAEKYFLDDIAEKERLEAENSAREREERMKNQEKEREQRKEEEKANAEKKARDSLFNDSSSLFFGNDD